MTPGRRVLLLCMAAFLCVGWSETTVRYVAWSAVEFFPPDLRRHVRREHRRFDEGIRRGLTAPPAWRAGPPGKVEEALESQVLHCAEALQRPVPLADLVEELGVLSVRVLDANDPLAVRHDDPREPTYAEEYERYVDSVRDRLRLVYYGHDPKLVREQQVRDTVGASLIRSRELYPFLGQEFYRTGALRDWRSFDDRSVAFGVAGISLSRALTDLANYAAFVWKTGGGRVPAPRPTPPGHVGPTVTVLLDGGFPQREKPPSAPGVLPERKLVLPPP